jgi:hypothetical protein
MGQRGVCGRSAFNGKATTRGSKGEAHVLRDEMGSSVATRDQKDSNNTSGSLSGSDGRA